MRRFRSGFRGSPAVKLPAMNCDQWTLCDCLPGNHSVPLHSLDEESQHSLLAGAPD